MDDAALGIEVDGGDAFAIGARELDDGSFAVLNAAQADCCCEDQPIQCWIQLLPCGCNDLAFTFFAPAGIIASAPLDHRVLRFENVCARIISSFVGAVPPSKGWSLGFENQVGDFIETLPDCDSSPCTNDDCPDVGCIPPAYRFNSLQMSEACGHPDPIEWCAAKAYFSSRASASRHTIFGDDDDGYTRIHRTYNWQARGSVVFTETGDAAIDVSWAFAATDVRISTNGTITRPTLSNFTGQGTFQGNESDPGYAGWTSPQMPGNEDYIYEHCPINLGGPQAGPRADIPIDPVLGAGYVAGFNDGSIACDNDDNPGLFAEFPYSTCGETLVPTYSNSIECQVGSNPNNRREHTRAWNVQFDTTEYWQRWHSLSLVDDLRQYFADALVPDRRDYSAVSSSGSMSVVFIPRDFPDITYVDECPTTVRIFECNGPSSVIIDRRSIRIGFRYVSVLVQASDEEEPERKVFDILSAQFEDGDPLPILEYLETCGPATATYPVLISCDGSRTITYDSEVDPKPSGAVTATSGGDRFVETPGTSEQEPSPVVWTQTPCDPEGEVWERCSSEPIPGASVASKVRVLNPPVGDVRGRRQIVFSTPCGATGAQNRIWYVWYRRGFDDGGAYLEIPNFSATDTRACAVLNDRLAFTGPCNDDGPSIPGDPVDPTQPPVSINRRRKPYPIPDDFDPERERRRAQQGGCCH